MVVSLNDSDDSDSDMDACSSTQTVFGGLEFMIREARRTVEVGHLLNHPVIDLGSYFKSGKVKHCRDREQSFSCMSLYKVEKKRMLT